VSRKAQQQPVYKKLPPLLRRLREEAGLTQRDIGMQLKKPQSWVYNCESANRRVDVTEFILWATACRIDPREAFGRILGEMR
jgi:transcriptional regulator with XRE-family HTH domain